MVLAERSYLLTIGELVCYVRIDRQSRFEFPVR
jgi:hypothetical protein